MAVELTGIAKSYGHVQALEAVDFRLEPGEVVGLLGDNGAGKSTLMKILAGVLRPDAGTIVVDGAACSFGSPIEARQAGIAMLFQDLALFDDLSVVANVFLGRELTGPSGFLRYGAMRRRARALVAGFPVRPFGLDGPVGELAGGQRQVTALARTLGFGGRYVILDEPTSALSPGAREEVLAVVRRLADQGIGVVMVSHDLAHVRRVCDRVVVLHLGRVAGVRSVATTSQAEIVSLIVQGQA